MSFSLRSRWWWALAAALCLLLAQLAQPAANAERQRYRLVARTENLEGVPPEYILTNALLGGFRSVLIQALWQRAQNMKNENRYYEMVDIYNITTKLQPGHHMAWAFLAWDLSYNVSVDFQNLEDRVFWVFRGIDLLRFQGIPKNDRIPELPYELAWIFHHKLGASLDFAHPYYRLTLANQVRSAMLGDLDANAQAELVRVLAPLPKTDQELRQTPEYLAAAAKFREAGLPEPFLFGPFLYQAKAEELSAWLAEQRKAAAAGDEESAKLLAGLPPGEANTAAIGAVLADASVRATLRSVYYWHIANNLRERCGFDIPRMLEIVRRYGNIDWRTPYAHALYWASVAFDLWWAKPDKQPDLKYERLIYFSLIQLAENSRLIQGSDGFVHYLPDPRMVDAVCAHMDGLLQRYFLWRDNDGGTTSLIGMMSAYGYFLRDQMFAAYFEGREQQARRLLDRWIMAQWQRQLDALLRDKHVTPEQADWIFRSDLSKIPELAKVLDLDERLRGNVADVVAKNMKEYLDSPGPDKAISLLESWLGKGYWSLALGDADQYRRQMLMAQTFYQKYCLHRWPQDKADVAGELDNRHYIPPLDDIRMGVLEKVFTGETKMPYSLPLMRNLDAQLRTAEPQLRTRLVGRLQMLAAPPAAAGAGPAPKGQP